MRRQPHVIVVPLPAQGHVKPLMQLSHKLVDRGIKVTFVNTEFIHTKVIARMSPKEIEESRVMLASVPDGLEPEEDRKDIIKLLTSIRRVVPGHLLSLIEEINNESRNHDDDSMVSCVIGDVTIGWILDVAKRIGIEGIGFMPMSAATLVLTSTIHKLINGGIIDENGTNILEEKTMVSKDIPPWLKNELTWSFPIDISMQKALFEIFLTVKETFDQADWLICNTLNELEHSACNLIPKLLPIGPLHANVEVKNSAINGNFWEEDSSCLNWLNKQKPRSVIYVSFGSFAVMNQTQFNELALGLQQSGQPFLWIVREDIIYGFQPEYPDGFLENVADHGMIVKWVPQEKVLSHPATACFLTHCGWNSTIEGLSAGLPFLCWPFYADQFHNKNYITDAWNVGLKLNIPDETVLISSDEISIKIQMLLSDEILRGNARNMKLLIQKSLNKEGSSFKNMEKFINHLKG